VLCDYLGFVFMFLSVATSNMVATSLLERSLSSFNTFLSLNLFYLFYFPYLVICDLRDCAETAVNCRVY